MRKEPTLIIKNGVLQKVRLPAGCTEIVIPNSVHTIDEYAFYHHTCNSLQSVVIPDSVTTIGPHAFYACISLHSICIPNSVTKISNDAFAHCTSLQSITIPDSVTEIGECAFDHCTSLQSITLPNSIVSIGWNAFHYCESLQSIVIPDSVVKLESYILDECYSLQSAVVPEHLDCLNTYNYELQCAKENIPIKFLFLDNSLSTVYRYKTLHYLSNCSISFNTYQIKQIYQYLHSHEFDHIDLDVLHSTGLLYEATLFSKEHSKENAIQDEISIT